MIEIGLQKLGPGLAEIIVKGATLVSVDALHDSVFRSGARWMANVKEAVGAPLLTRPIEARLEFSDGFFAHVTLRCGVTLCLGPALVT